MASLGLSELVLAPDHESQIFFKHSGLAMDLSCSGDPSLFVGGTIDIEGLERWNQSGWKEKALDKGGVDEISHSSTIYEGGGGNSSCSVL